MEVPRLGVELQLQLPAYITATATPHPSCICNLYHSSRQRQILNLLSEARILLRLHGYQSDLFLLSHDKNFLRSLFKETSAHK